MHVSVAEYRIRDIDDAGWAVACDELAPAFAAVPGLLTKYWLHGNADIRGGVYIGGKTRGASVTLAPIPSRVGVLRC